MKRTKKRTTPFQSVMCPVCEGANYTVLRPGRFPEQLSESFLQNVYRSSSDHGLFEQVVRCSDCSTVYLNPQLTGDRIVNAYAEGEDKAHLAQDAMRIRTFTAALRSLARQHAIPLTNSTNLLDIGCASGAFVRAAHDLGMAAIGIEPNRWMAAYGKKTYGLDIRAGTLSDHTFTSNSLDVVTLWDVIEHLPNPTAELTEIARILKPNGLLIVNYPDYTSLPARLLGWKWPFWLSVHLTYYSPTTIRRHLEATGFEVRDLAPHWQTLELNYVLKRMTPYVKFAQLPRPLLERTGLGHLPLTYWAGQTRVVARKLT